ncbi:MAG: hypothetical protein IKD70_05700 [Eggerthellaceae bacterium]|nr:hypothetical protein [Eggerthellaceae bacterium]
MDAVRISNERRYLTFEITDEQGEGHTYTIPLLTSLPASFARKASAIARLPEDEAAGAFMELQFDMLEQYAPGITDIATAADLKQILELWSQATAEAGGDLGE